MADQRDEAIGGNGLALAALPDALFAEGFGDHRPGHPFLVTEATDLGQGGADQGRGAGCAAGIGTLGVSGVEALGGLAQCGEVEGHSATLSGGG